MEQLDDEDEATGEGGKGEDQHHQPNGQVRHPVQVQQERAPAVLQLYK